MAALALTRPNLFAPARPDPADILARRYAAMHKERWQSVLAGPHGPSAAALRAWLRRLAPDHPQPAGSADLLAHIQSQGWLIGADEPTRRAVFRQIGQAIGWACKRRGIPDDDPLWGEWGTEYRPGVRGKVKDVLCLR